MSKFVSEYDLACPGNLDRKNQQGLLSPLISTRLTDILDLSLKKNPKQDSIFKEAWDNMSGDMEKLLPEKLRKREGKKKFFLWLALLELLVLGVAGKFLYDWLTG